MGHSPSLGFLLALALLPAPASTASPWSARAALNEARQEVAVAELAGKVYVIGGFRSDASIADTVEVWDPESDGWSFAASLPIAVHHAAVASTGGKLYVMGGWSDFFATPRADLFEYDPAADAWTPRTSMPTARGAPSAAVIDGRIYVVGGWPGAQDFATYHPPSDTWTPLANMPTGRNHLGAAAVAGRFYAAGGRTTLGPDVNVADLEVYDPDTGIWTALTAMPEARSGVAAAAVGRFFLIFGGEGNDQDPSGVFPDVDAYDSVGGTWAPLTPMPTPRHGIGAATRGFRIHIPGGGPVEGFGVSAVHEVYDATIELDLPAVPALTWLGAAVCAAALLTTGLALRGRRRL